MTDTAEDIFSSILKVVDDYELAQKILRQILEDNGGLRIYLPQAESAFRAEKETAIMAEFNGLNSKELCRKYQISSNTFYTILRRHRERQLKSLNFNLFPEE